MAWADSSIGWRRLATGLVALFALGYLACAPVNVVPARDAGRAKTASAPISFNQQIEPILSDNCYQCHGPDKGSRRGDLRLDHREFATVSRGKSGPAITPGDADHSLLVQRIESSDLKQRMPPIEAHKELKPDEIALLRRWVAEGAPYEAHWAFLPIRRPLVPTPREAGWARNPIDCFVLARLEQEALPHSPEADPANLARRVAYDLTGLPPEPEVAAPFLQNPSPENYEKLVDHLLSSPRYGEHRAHYWLDVARFGDTHGLHGDGLRDIWPYRDYVIQAFNANKPFDQFVREQLAGDLLPAENVDQLVATAFIRAGISSNEGGTLPEELRVNNQRERTEAYGAAFLGLTVGCAACHDHKFDPTSQKDFYQLTAFFNNLTENPVSASADWPPFVRVPEAARRAAFNQTLAQRAMVEREIDVRRAQAKTRIAAWLSHATPALPQPVDPAGFQVQLRFDEGQGATFANSAPGAQVKTVSATGGAPAWNEQIWHWPSMRMETSTRIELPVPGDFERDQAFSVGVWLLPRYESYAVDTPKFGAIAARSDSAHGHRGWSVRFNQGKVEARLACEWPDNAICVSTRESVLSRGRWNHVLVTYDGSARAAGLKIYLDGRPADLEVTRDALSGSIRTRVSLELGREYPDAEQLRQSCYQDFRLYARALTAEEARRLPAEDYVAEITRRPSVAWSEQEAKIVSDFYFTERDREMQQLVAQLPALQAELDRSSEGGAKSLICEESPQLPYAYVLNRGVFSARGELVRPDTPHFLPRMAPGLPHNRRGLAEWTVSAENPLTARVTVNRMWQEIFGTGLVQTTEDFGLVGQRPSHAGLLDWLAADFRESGWDVKRCYKQIVMSATYRQSSHFTPLLRERDPGNRLLARGPRFRMDAEMLRDTVLAASGLLVEKQGGPSVKPYQPPDIWKSGGLPESKTTKYVQDHGEALYRRSLYTFWKRMATMPDMDAFDAPVRDITCTRRQRTDTPLQALVVMNDPQWLEAARRLGERLVAQNATTEKRFDDLGRLLLARPWHPAERQILQEALRQFQATYDQDPRSAAQLILVGESKPDPTLPAPEVAAWMLVASAAMNFDSVLNK